MDSDNRFEKMLGSVSKDKFRQNANKLLNECFMLKGCADTKNSYYFILKEKEIFSEYFDLLGYELIINEEFGIIALNNSYGTGRIRLRLLDSIILLFLRLIYIEERKKLSQSEQVIVEVDELYERYRSLKNERLKKTDMRSSLGLLKKYHIVFNLGADMGNPNTRLLNMILLAMRKNSGVTGRTARLNSERVFLLKCVRISRRPFLFSKI